MLLPKCPTVGTKHWTLAPSAIRCGTLHLAPISAGMNSPALVRTLVLLHTHAEHKQLSASDCSSVQVLECRCVLASVCPTHLSTATAHWVSRAAMNGVIKACSLTKQGPTTSINQDTSTYGSCCTSTA